MFVWWFFPEHFEQFCDIIEDNLKCADTYRTVCDIILEMCRYFLHDSLRHCPIKSQNVPIPAREFATLSHKCTHPYRTVCDIVQRDLIYADTYRKVLRHYPINVPILKWQFATLPKKISTVPILTGQFATLSKKISNVLIRTGQFATLSTKILNMPTLTGQFATMSKKISNVPIHTQRSYRQHAK